MSLPNTPSDLPVAIVGGGPAGSTAALCLRRLGRRVVLFERQEFPRYRIGESLLPGTLSIMSRLGLSERIAAAGFPVKRAATFLWGADHRPWSFTFSTPKTAPWVFDHSYQVTRAEYDKILLDAAEERGADVRKPADVVGIEGGMNGEPAVVRWKNGSDSGELEAAFVIDASGAAGVIAKKLNLRQFDEYYKNLAVWAYFRGGRRYKGDLEGNILSVSFKRGWIWMIPLKDDEYSVGVVTGVEFSPRMKEIGLDAFYDECLAMCPMATEVLATATRKEEAVRVVRDWAYDSSKLSVGRFFLSGDSGCFIDPLFSQGVHLATYSATLAAAAADYLYDHPGDADAIRCWYDHSYLGAYDRYHRFLSAFYANCDEEDSAFWSSRRIAGARDQRFTGQEWFRSLAGEAVDDEEAVAAVEENAETLMRLWDHGSDTVSEDFDETKLSLRRVQWFGELVKQFRTITRFQWRAGEGKLIPWFQVDRTTFSLTPQPLLGDSDGRMLSGMAATDEHLTVLREAVAEGIGYRELVKRLKPLSGQNGAVQMVHRLVEDGILQGLDKEGREVRIRPGLRFGGVGADDDIS